jgi:CubicO group peptidase (beta-lactamase class C family)
VELATAGSTTAAGDGQLDAYIEGQMAAAHVPGLAIAVVKRGAVQVAKGYGYADLAAGTPVTPATAFRLASVSKTVTGAALMQLWEQGRFALDDDIDDALPFPVRNPSFPDQPITYRMLLTHTAGIADNYTVIDPLWNRHGDAATPLADLVRDYFTPGRSLYRAANFLPTAPGSAFSYANMGVALAGYLVEALSGASFAAATTDGILGPLGMTSASWRLSGFKPQGGLATPYLWNADAGSYTALDQYGYPEVPAGMLMASVDSLARFLLLLAGGGGQVLAPETVAEMGRVQFPTVRSTQGLIFYYIDGPAGPKTLIGHNGGDDGVATEMYWVAGDPNGLGVIVLANTDATSGDGAPGKARANAFYGILNRLFEYGAGL